jgi:peptidoglycan/LPS O-acetylase OafA/YrhL
MRRIPTLDGWRAIAILLVLVDHALAALNLGPGGTTGQHGVTIFFVLSGFLITSRLADEKQSTGSINLRRFYLHRFFRLMPAAYFYLVFAFIFCILISRATWRESINFVAALLFFRNYSIHLVPADWITGHFWTLSIEEQFYIVWPSMLAFVNLRSARWIAVAGALIISIYRFAIWSTALPMYQTQDTQLRADSLLAGCAVALFMPKILPYLRDWMTLPLVAAFALCVARYQVLIPLHESLIIAFLLAITTSSKSRAFYFLNWRPVAFLGMLSYSLYLWQQPFTLVARCGWIPFICAVVLLPCVALYSYYRIEKPFIERSHRKQPAPPEVVGG